MKKTDKLTKGIIKDYSSTFTQLREHDMDMKPSNPKDQVGVKKVSIGRGKLSGTNGDVTWHA